MEKKINRITMATSGICGEAWKKTNKRNKKILTSTRFLRNKCPHEVSRGWSYEFVWGDRPFPCKSRG